MSRKKQDPAPDEGTLGLFVEPGIGKGALSKRAVGDLLRIGEVLEGKDYDPIGALIEEARLEEDPEKRLAIHYAILPYVYQRLPALASPEAGEDGGGKSMSFTVKL